MANITLKKLLYVLAGANGRNILIDAYIEMHIDWSGMFSGAYQPNDALYVNPTSMYMFVLLGLFGFELQPPSRTNIMMTYHPKMHQLKRLHDMIVDEMTDEELGKATVRVANKDKCMIGENTLRQHVEENYVIKENGHVQ